MSKHHAGRRLTADVTEQPEDDDENKNGGYATTAKLPCRGARQDSSEWSLHSIPSLCGAVTPQLTSQLFLLSSLVPGASRGFPGLLYSRLYAPSQTFRLLPLRRGARRFPSTL